MRQRNGRSLHCTFCKKYLKVMLSLVLNMSYSDGMSGYKLVNSDCMSGYKLVNSDVKSGYKLVNSDVKSGYKLF